MFSRRRVENEPEINLIPLIDLLLVILIFLMLSTTYNRFSRYHLNLPTAAHKKEMSHSSEIDLMILKNGYYVIDSYKIAPQYRGRLSDLFKKIITQRQISPSSALVLIHADAQAPTQSVVGVMEALGRVQISHVGFVVRDPS